MNRNIMPAIAIAAMSVVAVPSQASEDGFINRFAGQWSGSGKAQRAVDDSPWQLDCSMDGDSARSRIMINGTCRAAIIASRPFSADIRYDQSSRRYTGTYTGARVGPARLSGRRRGDAVVMTVTWPKPVNGDTKATLTIRNPGSGRMAIILTDQLRPGGPQVAATSMSLRKD